MNREKKGTSQFKPLPEIEQAICKRLGEARKRSLLTQGELAYKVGITRDQLANIESMRVPLRFWIGWQACQLLDIPQFWLAFGGVYRNGFSGLDFKKYHPDGYVPDGALFSEIVNGELKRKLESIYRYQCAMLGRDRESAELVAPMREAIESIIEYFLLRIPSQARDDFLVHLATFGKNFIEKIPDNCSKDEGRKP